MKLFALFFALGLSVQVFESQAQNITTTTNTITTASAASVAAQLEIGMTEQAAAAVLKRHGICQYLGTNVYSVSVGCSHGWTTSYPLADGRSLDLDFRPSSMRPDGLWGGNGLLERIGIRSNGVDVVSIMLKSAQPGGPANGSQPIRSETNIAPSAAGSRL